MIKPILNQILIKPQYTSNVTKSGLIIPDNCTKQNNCGVVVAVGRGSKNRPMEFKENDTIYFIKDAYVPIEDNGELYHLVDDINVLTFKRQ